MLLSISITHKANMSAINRINVNSRNGRVTESKADLVAMEASGGEYLIQFILLFHKDKLYVFSIGNISFLSDSNGQHPNGAIANQITFTASAWARR